MIILSGSSEIIHHQRELSSQKITGVSPEQAYPTEHPSPYSPECPTLVRNTRQPKKASYNNAMVETKPKTAFASQQQKLKELKTGKAN